MSDPAAINLAWQFERGSVPLPNGEMPIRITFTLGGDLASSTLTFVVPESIAIGIRNDLAQQCSGLTVARSIDEGIAP